MKVIKTIFAIILMPFYLPMMLLIGLIIGIIEGFELTCDVFNGIVDGQ